MTLEATKTGFTFLWRGLFGGGESIQRIKENSDSLVILLHGWTESPSTYRHLIDSLGSEYPTADILVPRLPLTTFSMTSLDDLAGEVAKGVQTFINTHRPNKPYRDIVLVGHSCGGIIARLVYLHALGVHVEQGKVIVPNEPKQSWLLYLNRIVLLAAVNRGWTISSATHPALRFFSPILIGIGNILSIYKSPSAFQIRRGAPLITNMRLKWLAVQRKNKKLIPPVIQVLGTIDDIVAPEDNVDSTTGSDFIYLEAPQSGHFDVLDTKDKNLGQGRLKVLMSAIRQNVKTLLEEQNGTRTHFLKSYMGNELTTGITSNRSGKPNEKVDVVCFVIHGIRDNGFWTRKIANKACQIADSKNKTCTVYTPSYGFFPLISFALPWTRRAKVEWFMDLYVDVVNEHHDSEMVYLGHSNGTYLAAKALTLCPSMKFDRILFAGSVVQKGYNWTALKAQTGRVINLVATSDWVVALFPSAFERIPIQDLGSAGHSGFIHLADTDSERMVQGQHDAGIRENLWSGLAQYIVSGSGINDLIGEPLDSERKSQSWLVKFFNLISPLSWAGALLIVVYGTWLITVLGPEKWALSHFEVAALYALFLAFIMRVLTKF